MNTIGDRIKYVRHDILGLNQQDFAELVGVKSKTAISLWEKNERQPDLNTVVKICSISKVSANWLLGVNMEDNQTENSGVFIDNSTIIEENKILKEKLEELRRLLQKALDNISG